MSRLDQIKAQQQAETGINPYTAMIQTASVVHGLSNQSLADYQAAMDVDLAKVSATPDIAEKARIKAVLLPTYLNWVLAYVASGDNYPNSVASQVMVWCLDTLDIVNGLNIALHLVQQKQRLPKKFDRDMPTFLCDFFYDWANDQLKTGRGVSPHLDKLVETAERDQWEVHPLCISKIMVILAKYKEIAGEYQQALTLCLKAEQINPEKAGVKGITERLRKRLLSAEGEDIAAT